MHENKVRDRLTCQYYQYYARWQASRALLRWSRDHIIWLQGWTSRTPHLGEAVGWSTPSCCQSKEPSKPPACCCSRPSTTASRRLPIERTTGTEPYRLAIICEQPRRVG